jgi:enoyl-CoA hydratase
MSEKEALSNEFQHGLVSLEARESLRGAQRFAEGHGRHGDFEEI